MALFVELRNIHTHNRSKANDLFLFRISKHKTKYKFTKGKEYYLNFDQFAEFSRNAIEIAARLDKELCGKFKIKRFRYKKRLERDRKHLEPVYATA